MISQIRHGSVVALAMALAGCASGGSTAATPSSTATPTSNRQSTEAMAATGAIPLQGLQWTGKFRPSQAISGTTSGRADVNGSIRLTAAPAGAKVARASRILVEGVHDAELVEKVWGDDLRDVGVVVERLDGMDDLSDVVRDFEPAPERRLGQLPAHPSAETATRGRHADSLTAWVSPPPSPARL